MTVYLTNPPRGTAMAHRARYTSGPKKGQFKPKASRRRSTTRKRSTTRRRSTARRAPARRRRASTRRRNPDIVKTTMKGAKGALFVLGGEAAAKAIPQQFNLPTSGTTGLAVQTGVAVAVGLAADRFIGREAGARMLEGALSVPLRAVIVGANIPVLSQALSGYVVPRQVRAIPGGRQAGRNRVAGYVQPRHLSGATRTMADRYQGSGVI